MDKENGIQEEVRKVFNWKEATPAPIVIDIDSTDAHSDTVINDPLAEAVGLTL